MSWARIRTLSLASSASYTYRGQPRDSYAPLDRAELVELRARMRTFDQAYTRTALQNLSYSVVVLKLFDRRFHRIGLLFAVLSAILYVLALVRRNHSNIDFADQVMPESARQSRERSSSFRRRIHGRPFRTAGNVVLAVSIVVAAVHIALLGLIFQI